MGRREQARVDAAFHRGDVGVDGRATEVEERDEAELERGKAREGLLRGGTWLGREFLTWLLWRSDGTEAVVQEGGEAVAVVFTNRLVLRGIHGDTVELAVKGAMSPYSVQVRRALEEGLLVHAARLRLTVGDRTWEASIDAEHFDIRSAKLPELLTEEEDDRLVERLELAGRASRLVDALVARFIEVRTGKTWSKDVVPKLKAWMRGEGEKAPTLERARRAASA